MPNGRRHSLPLVPPSSNQVEPPAKPSVEVARRNLGGRATTSPDAGKFVSLMDARDDGPVVGVVLYASDTEIDVWIENGIVRRTHPSEATPYVGTVPPHLRKLADDARLFSTLHEGQKVHYESSKDFAQGAIVEKCRYGALVVRDDGRLMAVGFRKLWPLAAAGAALN